MWHAQLANLIAILALVSACSRTGGAASGSQSSGEEPVPTPRAEVPALEGTSRPPTAAASTDKVADVHDSHDCRTDHPSKPRELAPAFARLTPQAAAQTRSVRITSRDSAMLLRRAGTQWTSFASCALDQERVRQLLGNLQSLKEAPTSVLPREGLPEVRVIFVGTEGRLYHLDVFQRIGNKDIVELDGGKAREVTGLNRELLDLSRAAWCGKRSR